MKTLILFFLSTFAFAYIPQSSFVFNRVAELHGKGAYKITQELAFKGPAETQVVKETWIIVDGGEMLLKAEGEGLQVTRLLKKGRIYTDTSSENPNEFYMSALTTRDAGELKKFFHKWGILPNEALREKYVPKDLKLLKLETEKFVRLGRVGGAIQYQYGKLDQATVWIEQDQFFISKIRMPSGAEFLGQDYAIFARNFAYPKTQKITFGDNSVEIVVKSVYGINLTNAIKKTLEPSSLKNNEEIVTLWPKHSLANVIGDFYKRFR
ncbi:MAG: hypothetical protein IPM57_05070 [Oligoflexia bacterium]|nr:hypothetical protein [Oligoflexia bacterium]